MHKTKIVQFRVDKKLFEMIVNQANVKGFVKYSDYLRDLCAKDNLIDLKINEKLNLIMKELDINNNPPSTQ